MNPAAAEDSTSFILSPEGESLMAQVQPYSEADALRTASRLRAAGYPSDHISAALTQARLRQKAASKFGPFAASLFFTAQGLEQSTRLAIGAHHAARFREAGARHVIDFGCGIGADSLAFAALGLRVTAIEIDPATSAFTTRNLAAFPEARVIQADGDSLALNSLDADALWLDPARRDATGRRLHRPEQWSPPLSSAIAKASGFRAAGIKVAPGISYDDCPPRAHVQWISDHGDLVEAVIWLGTAAGTPGRSALLLTDSGVLTYTADAPLATTPIAEVSPTPLGDYVYEPDPAIIRCGGIGQLCADHPLAPVSRSIAYLSGGRIDSPFLTRFRVLDVVALRAKEISRALRAHGITRTEIKKRGTDVSPETLRASLTHAPGGADTPGVVILTPIMGKHRAVIALRD